jgi:hydrogenase maturation protein HypF
MLPYAPLHHLLIGDRPLVMTSGNLSEEPIARDNDEAIERLSRLADGFLLHDRGIHAVCDDSVVRVFRDAELPIRRSRGYTPFPVVLDTEPLPILAVGGELKATLCVTKGSNAYLSQHIGDMANLETMQAFERALEHLGSLFRTAPTKLACDLHPGYLSTQWAHRYARTNGISLVPVQHHHAHIASVMAEHGLAADARVIGVAWDGTGYGSDGTIWGGEFLEAGYRDFERAGYLRPIPLPGGDAAIKRPYRSALAHLFAAGLEWSSDLPCVSACPPEELKILRHQMEHVLNCVPCTSMGRLFDALASLTGICQKASYEAQPAMELEALAGSPSNVGYDSAVDGDFPLRLDPKPLLQFVIADLRAGRERDAIARKIHTTVAGWLTNACCRIRGHSGLDTVALSGGTFQNVLLLEQTVARLEKEGFRVLVHRLVPPNDGGLALGQVAIAAARHC